MTVIRIRKMKFVCLMLFAIGFAGCASVPLDEINYSGKPLAPGVDAFAEAERFAPILAQDAQLQVVDSTKRTGNAQFDSQAEIDLKRERTSKVLVRVIVYAAQQEVRVMIQPASATPLSEELAAAAVRSYHKLYGASEFSRWQTYQGFLGP